ncbi:MAG: FliH/SctL family protein [Desulfosalsimonadaceae bacterium]
MSRIYSSDSGVHFETIRFKDLEEEELAGSGDFFMRKCPAETKPLDPEADEDSQASSAAEPSVDVAEQREKANAKGREEGYAEGKKDGRSEVEKELHTAAQALAEGVEQVSRLRESLFSRSREDMVRLVMAVARRVIEAEVEKNEDIIVKTVNRTIDSAVEAEQYYIRVNPADLEKVKENEPLFLAAMKGLENIQFIADEAISPGGCRAESRAGDVDATIESQMEKIEEHLRAEIVD